MNIIPKWEEFTEDYLTIKSQFLATLPMKATETIAKRNHTSFTFAIVIQLLLEC